MKKIILFILTVTCAVCFFSCSTGNNAKPQEQGTTVPIILSTPEDGTAEAQTDQPTEIPATSQPTDVPEPLQISGTVKLTVNNESGTEKESLAPRATLKAFKEKYPDVTVIYEESNRTTYPQRIAAGDIGDVFWVDSIDTVKFQSQNALLALDPFIPKMNIDIGDVFAGSLDAGMVGGSLYMVPRDYNNIILTYNNDMLTEAGISFDNSVAMSWDEFKNICKRVTVIEESGRTLRAGAALKIWWPAVWEPFINGFGGKWIDTENRKINISNDPKVMQGFEELLKGIEEGWLYPEDLQLTDPYISNKYSAIPLGDANVSHVCFKNFGSITWMDRIGGLYDSKGIDWNFCPFPALPNHTVSSHATGYAVYSGSNNLDAAAALALFFLTPEGQTAYHSEPSTTVPVLKSLAEENFWKGTGTSWTDKNYGAFVAYPDLSAPFELSLQLPPEVADIFSSNNMITVFTKAINGFDSIENLLTQLQTKANGTWEKISRN